jgi:hypothetical protein
MLIEPQATPKSSSMELITHPSSSQPTAQKRVFHIYSVANIA